MQVHRGAGGESGHCYHGQCSLTDGQDTRGLPASSYALKPKPLGWRTLANVIIVVNFGVGVPIRAMFFGVGSTPLFGWLVKDRVYSLLDSGLRAPLTLPRIARPQATGTEVHTQDFRLLRPRSISRKHNSHLTLMFSRSKICFIPIRPSINPKPKPLS